MDRERPSGLTDQPELGHQIFRRLWPVRLVLGIDVRPEGFRGVIENNRKMGRLIALLWRQAFLQQLPKHVAEARHGANRQPVRLAGQGRQRVVGAKDEGGAIDQNKVVV